MLKIPSIDLSSNIHLTKFDCAILINEPECEPEYSSEISGLRNDQINRTGFKKQSRIGSSEYRILPLTT